jgi:hypothetical protein
MSDSLLIVGVFICIGVFLIVAYGLYSENKKTAAAAAAAAGAAYPAAAADTAASGAALDPGLGGRRRYRYHRGRR